MRIQVIRNCEGALGLVPRRKRCCSIEALRTFSLEDVNGSQVIDPGGKHHIRSLKLYKLIKCDNPSAFPALRQIEVYGVDL